MMMMMMMMMIIIIIIITVAVAVIITTTINTCRKVGCVEASSQPSCNRKILRLPSGETSYLCRGADRSVFFEIPLIKYISYFYTSLHIRVCRDVSAWRAEALVVQLATQEMELANLPKRPNRLYWVIKVSVHLMITVQTTRKNILNSLNHLP
jgi:hypothetical protein